MIVSLSLAGIIRSGGILIWGPEPKSIPPIFGTGNITFLGTIIPVRNVYIFLGTKKRMEIQQ